MSAYVKLIDKIREERVRSNSNRINNILELIYLNILLNNEFDVSFREISNIIVIVISNLFNKIIPKIINSFY